MRQTLAFLVVLGAILALPANAGWGVSEVPDSMIVEELAHLENTGRTVYFFGLAGAQGAACKAVAWVNGDPFLVSTDRSGAVGRFSTLPVLRVTSFCTSYDGLNWWVLWLDNMESTRK